MRKIIFNDKEYNILDSWDELNIQNYIDIIELYQNIDNQIEEMFLVKFISILSDIPKDELLNSYDEDLIKFTEIIEEFKLDNLLKEPKYNFNLNDKLYAWNNMNKLTLGEKISLKLLDKQSKNQGDAILNLLSIIVRPAKEKTNEFGEVEYDVEPFVGDMSILEKRKELCKKILAKNALFILDCFTDGIQK